MKKILALALPLLLTVMSVRADVIWQEQFNYTNGPIIVTSTNVVGGSIITNWIRYSGTANPSDLLVSNNQLQVGYTLSGNVYPSRQDDGGRPFANVAGSPYTNSQQVIYISFIVNFTSPPAAGTTYFSNLKYGSYTGTSYEGKVFASLGNLTNTVRLGVSLSANTANQTFATDLALNTPYQVVEMWDPVTLDALSLWVNPITSSDPKITSSDSFIPSGANIANMVAFRQASTFGAFMTVSNLILATSFDEVFTNSLATNAVPPQVVTQPVAISTNFQNDSASLSAVANGQGLANLTYQWQVSSSPANTSPANVSNPNGNSNVLSLDTSTLGNSYYTLVVTTPWSLSTTSSVAKVAILQPVGPPAFVTQPVSQTSYAGGTVTLTTSVTSPVNPTYTWYSNNVVVTAGQQDSGLSSSLVINNLSVGTATYKVAVTNSTTIVGIVSTNAVVTVGAIQAVSVAFVRSLIDPVTLQATNNTTPYSVTGIITTYTNITSGNTASYYLQDGTGGINIFATFGSTFRPAQGDSVTFVGVTSSFSSGLELGADLVNKPYTGGVINSSGNALPTPTVIPFTLTNTFSLAYVATNVAGSLVTLQNVYFGTNAGNTISSTDNQNVTVTNASGNSFILSFFDVDQDTTNQIIPSFASSVTGVLFGNTTNYSLAVTKWSDINISVPVVPIPLTTTYAAGILTFNWADGSFVLQDSTNVVGPYFTIPGANTGFMTNTTTEAALFFRLFHP